jgi:1,4-alpha-glucan branching enzyme
VRANENGIDPKSASPYKSYVVNSSGSTLRKVRVFFRDPATGAQVWSANTGYPGGQWYLDFHAKRRLPGEVLPGLRYWRVSPHGTPEEGKSLYEPEKISEQVQDNARHFALVVRDSLRQRGDGPESIVCSVYDTELFGHWWYEGPDFLYHAIKEIDAIEEIRRATCMEHIDSLPESSSDSICLPEGSWGANSTHEVWLNTDTNWIWKEIYGAEAKLEKLNSLSQSRIKRITAQAKREFLLLTSSDWPFLVTGGAARDYAELRFHTHLTHFNYLCDMANKASQGEDISKNDWKNLADCEQMDRIFTEL